jgi:hypothetical protein
MLDTAVLSQTQREHYQRNGSVAVPGLVDSEWLGQLRACAPTWAAPNPVEHAS